MKTKLLPVPDATLRVTDNRSIQAAVNDMKDGQKLKLEGAFQKQAFTPKKYMTIFCETGKASIDGGFGSDVVVRCKTGDKTGAEGVTLINLPVSGGKRYGVLTWLGFRSFACDLSENGEMGAHTFVEIPNADILFKTTKFRANGNQNDLGHGASGAKMFHSDGVTYDLCWFEDNLGNGAWADAQSGHMKVTRSTFVQQYRKAVMYEKCGEGWVGYDKGGTKLWDGLLEVSYCTFIDNNVEDNDQANPDILVVASKNADIHHNTHDGNRDAIAVRDSDDRLHDDKPGYVTANVRIDTATNDYGDERVVGCDLAGVTC
jgi:hypothetical protein